MTATSTYRVDGLVAGLGVKAPCIAVTAAAITLSGEQTVNTVAVVEGDRVLVKDQADAKDNGIYEVETGTWTRSGDFDGNRDATNGTLVVYATSGTLVGFYQLTATNPVVIGETELTFTLVATLDLAGVLASTDNNKGASQVAIEDSGSNFTAANVEAALADLASTATGEGASIIGIEDAAGDITATDVEGGLAELAANRVRSATKDADLGRNTTITLTVDPDLTLANVPIGKYMLMATIKFNPGNATMGFKWRFQGADGLTFAFSNYPFFVVGTSTLEDQGFSAINASNEYASGSASYLISISSILDVTAAGTFRFDWAQRTSDGANLVLEDNSGISLVRIE